MKRRGVNVRVKSSSRRILASPHRDAIAIAGREGILNVCIAGNAPANQDLDPIAFPGDFDERSILNVAASTEADRLTDFSGFGATTVELAAPGVNIASLVKGATPSTDGAPLRGPQGWCRRAPSRPFSGPDPRRGDGGAAWLRGPLPPERQTVTVAG
jgi:subtilisin family serine protease